MNLERLYKLIKDGYYDYFSNKGTYPDSVILRPEHFELLPSTGKTIAGMKYIKSEYIQDNTMIFAEMNKCLVDLDPVFDFSDNIIKGIQIIQRPPFNIFSCE